MAEARRHRHHSAAPPRSGGGRVSDRRGPAQAGNPTNPRRLRTGAPILRTGSRCRGSATASATPPGSALAPGRGETRTLMRLAELIQAEFAEPASRNRFSRTGSRAGTVRPPLSSTWRVHRERRACPQIRRQGVVDTDCRVHGVAGLFVAGASVFPTSGHANPTLMIVAFADRLAAHLRRELARDSERKILRRPLPSRRRFVAARAAPRSSPPSCGPRPVREVGTGCGKKSGLTR